MYTMYTPGTHRGRKRASDCQELELQTVMSSPVWDLGIELRSAADRNHRAISSAPFSPFVTSTCFLKKTNRFSYDIFHVHYVF